MELADVLRRRRMVRNFDDRSIAPGVVDRILSAAGHAPSAGFTQGWDLLVLEGREQTERFWQSTFAPGERDGFRWPGLFQAPLIVVPLAHKQSYLDRYALPDKGWDDRREARWPVPYWYVDAGFAALLMLLTAVDEDLGALFFGVFAVDSFRDAFGIPAPYEPVGALAIGHPLPDKPSSSLARGRRPIEEVIHRARW